MQKANSQATELQKRGLRKAAKSWAMWEGLGLTSRWYGVHVSGSEPWLPISRAPENSRADRPWEALTIRFLAAGRTAAQSRIPGLYYSDAVNKAKNWMEGHQRSGYRAPKGPAHTLSQKSRLGRLTALRVKWHASRATFQAFMKDKIAPRTYWGPSRQPHVLPNRWWAPLTCTLWWLLTLLRKCH